MAAVNQAHSGMLNQVRRALPVPRLSMHGPKKLYKCKYCWAVNECGRVARAALRPLPESRPSSLRPAVDTEPCGQGAARGGQARRAGTPERDFGRTKETPFRCGESAPGALPHRGVSPPSRPTPPPAIAVAARRSRFARN